MQIWWGKVLFKPFISLGIWNGSDSGVMSSIQPQERYALASAGVSRIWPYIFSPTISVHQCSKPEILLRGEKNFKGI